MREYAKKSGPVGAEMWKAFPDLEGTRYTQTVSYRPRRRCRLRDEHGAIVADLAGHWPRSLLIGSDGYRIVRQPSHWWRPDVTAQASGTLVDRTTGDPVVDIRGVHFNWLAGTQLRFVDGTTFSFPVWGYQRSNAVMVARDSASQPAAYFRLTHDRLSTCEMVVVPGQLDGDERPIVLALGGSMLRRFLRGQGSGG